MQRKYKFFLLRFITWTKVEKNQFIFIQSGNGYNSNGFGAFAPQGQGAYPPYANGGPYNQGFGNRIKIDFQRSELMFSFKIIFFLGNFRPGLSPYYPNVAPFNQNFGNTPYYPGAGGCKFI